ncbi:TonB-dependent receptor [Novosphingobium olei]|uniref:TonB-dependent receptor n=1 Tax=Novosphingobium olei TaxID=2728851 RepID=A0A7Y0BMK9_9SPHN|nr:TonB-dependent receptor [Novosphingobium olei]NML93267.1 TonB-dependent receptor [Novosphingobium olei]
MRMSRKARIAHGLLLASGALLAAPALAQEAPQAPQADNAAAADGPDVIIVTAQKRSENLQKVPISIQALGEAKLEQLNVSNFNSYTQQLPSVVAQSAGTPGTNVIYMRGVASGGDGNHSGSLPSVGVYLDEQPVTTVGGNLDVHIYDVARIESLSGPQGTLYGASSEAGTLRIITNKPDTSGFYGRVDGEVNTVHKGGQGGKLEGMINVPFSQTAALRVVGYYQRDAGFIDNVAGCRSFLPESDPLGCPPSKNGGISVDNSAFVKKDYNDTEIYGGRAALKVDLDDNWTVTPTVMYQDTKSHGSYGTDARVGDLAVQHFFPEYRDDNFWSAALTIEGKLGNWDVTYAGSYMERKTYSSSDYTDYAETYDQLYASYGGVASYLYFHDAAGNTIDPRQKVIGTDHFKKISQELRIASPSDQPLRLVAGAFFQRQSNAIHQDYQVANLAPELSVNGSPGTLWLTQQERVDKDYAAFGELTWDITSKFSVTGGARLFKYDNSLVGFFGFGRNPGANGLYDGSPPNAVGSNRTGVAQCFTESGQRLYDRDTDTYATSRVLLPAVVSGSPCTNLGVYENGKVKPVVAKGDGVTWRFNATYKPTDTLMMYATVSKGFRPGGQNRRGDFGAYQPDYLINYELGLKTTLGGVLRLNAAIYQQDWKHFQFAYLGPNSFTVITNGPNARIRGFDIDAGFNIERLSVNVAAAYTDAKTRQNLCAVFDPTFTCATSSVQAPAGTRLPITPRFKATTTVRYTVPVGEAKVYGQFNLAYQSKASSDIRVDYAAKLGELPDFATVNLSLGADWPNYSLELFVQNLLDERGQLSRFVQCGACTSRPYYVPITPRTIGLRAGAKF